MRARHPQHGLLLPSAFMPDATDANVVKLAEPALTSALAGLGCDYGQGFLLGQPMPEERFIALLCQRSATPERESAPTAR